MTHQNPAACLFGALVADAASLGLHWIYDVERIAEIATKRGGRPAFTPLDAENFAGVPAYFAHGTRSDGMLTQYGEVLRLAIQSVNRNDGFEEAAYQQEYADHFGAGGQYQGYIDRPTKGTLANIAAGKLNPSGIDDQQLPALTTLPALVLARGRGDLSAQVEAAIQVTNVNADASAYGHVFADLLTRVLAGENLHSALRVSATKTETVTNLLLQALDTSEACSITYGKTTGRACHLPMAMPLAFHILARAETFQEAVERNILAGGDCAGRAIIIGAVMGAHHGIAGIPLEWALALHDGAKIWQECSEAVA